MGPIFHSLTLISVTKIYSRPKGGFIIDVHAEHMLCDALCVCVCVCERERETTMCISYVSIYIYVIFLL